MPGIVPTDVREAGGAVINGWNFTILNPDFAPAPPKAETGPRADIVD